MDDATGDRAGRPAHERSGWADGGVQFEETIALSDSDYGGLSRVTGAIALVSIVAMILFVPISFVVFFGIVAVASGNSIVDVGTAVASGLPLATVLFMGVFVLLFVGILLLGLLMVVKQGGLTFRDEIHTRVTGSSVDIDRDGGYLGQSSGVTIPFETVTTVEYNDPQGDLRMNLEDIRAKKFIGGRGGDWVRIGRSDGPAVYVGSDRSRELAAVVADLSPHVERAEPFS